MATASLNRRCVVKVSQPAAWWILFEVSAVKAGTTLSRWVADCAMRRLPGEVRARLDDPRPYNAEQPAAVRAVIADPTLRGNKRSLSLPAGLWVAALKDAERRGLTFSQWIGEACRESLPSELREKLSRRRSGGRPSYRDRKSRREELERARSAASVVIDRERLRVICRHAQEHDTTMIDAVLADASRPLPWVDEVLGRDRGADLEVRPAG